MNRTVENGLLPLADIAYDIVFQLLHQENEDGDNSTVIEVMPETLNTDFEEILAEIGVLLATNTYSLP